MDFGGLGLIWRVFLDPTNNKWILNVSIKWQFFANQCAFDAGESGVNYIKSETEHLITHACFRA